MGTGSDASQQSQARDRQTARPGIDTPEALVALSDEERRLIDVLQGQREGMSAGQLETKLALPRGGAHVVLESLRERRLVACLNTLIPTYIYRYGGVDLDPK